MTGNLRSDHELREILRRMGLKGLQSTGERLRVWSPFRGAKTHRPGLLAVLPVLRRPRLLIPLGDRRASAAALSLYSPQRALARVAKAIATAVLRLGIAQPFLRTRLSFVGSEPGSLHRSNDLFSHLQEVFDVSELSLAVSLGTPGVHRTPLIQVVELGGRVLGYVKVGWNPQTVPLVRHEESAIRRLESVMFSTAEVPRLLHAGPWGDCYLVAQSPPAGNARRGSNRLRAEHLTFIQELSDSARDVRRRTASELVRPVRSRLQELSASGLQAEAQLISQVLEICVRMAGGREIPMGPSHGDFAPWNTLALRGRIFVLDWEYFNEVAPAGWDLFHFVTQSAILVDRRSGEEILAFLRWDFRRVADRLLRTLQVPGELYPVLLGLYVADVASSYLVRHGGVLVGGADRLLQAWTGMMSAFVSSEASER